MSFNVGGTNANVNAQKINFTDGTFQITAYSEPAGSRGLFVDKYRTDAFGPMDGSFDRPFNTIMGAVNQVAANGDNGTFPYVINIAPGLYAETIDLSNNKLVNLVFEGANGVIIGNGSMTDSVIKAINNDNLFAVMFVEMIFQLNAHVTHGIQFSSTTQNTELGRNGIIFRGCGLQDNVSDVYFNNVIFIQLDNTGITANINATNVNDIDFVNGNGPNPQTPFSITTDTGTATPNTWIGYSRANFVGCGLGSVVCDALSQVQIASCAVSGALTTSSANVFIVANSFLTGDIAVNAGGVLGLVNSIVAQFGTQPTPVVTVNGVLLSALSYITNVAINVNSGGAFVEDAGVHDDGYLTVAAGGRYLTQGDMGLGTLTVAEHINTNGDLAGQLTVASGTSASFTFSDPYTDAPVVIVTPTDNPEAIGGYWVTTVNTGFTIYMKNSGTMAFNYIVMGAPN